MLPGFQDTCSLCFWRGDSSPPSEHQSGDGLVLHEQRTLWPETLSETLSTDKTCLSLSLFVHQIGAWLSIFGPLHECSDQSVEGVGASRFSPKKRGALLRRICCVRIDGTFRINPYRVSSLYPSSLRRVSKRHPSGKLFHQAPGTQSLEKQRDHLLYGLQAVRAVSEGRAEPWREKPAGECCSSQVRARRDGCEASRGSSENAAPLS